MGKGEISVYYDRRRHALLRPGNAPFTFGRGADRCLRLTSDPDSPISRNAGSILWTDGLWMVLNDSASIPFDVVVDGVANPLHPRTSSDARSTWAVGPRQTKIEVVEPGRVHVIVLEPHVVFRRPEPEPHRGPDGTTPHPIEPDVTDHDRLLLAARFLSLPEPGAALDTNVEAAEYASAAAGTKITVSAMTQVVHKWKKVLAQRNVQGLDDPGQIGRQLLAWGILQQEDRNLLKPRHPGTGSPPQ